MVTAEAFTANYVKRIGWRRVLSLWGVGVLILAGLYVGTRTIVSPTKNVTSAESGPRIFVPISRHNFGQVRAGTVLHADFTVRNHGPRRVVLYATRSGSTSHDVHYE